MTHPKLIFKRVKCYTIHLHLPSSKYALTRSYELGHYRSFWKVNKNTFFVKVSYMSMEYKIEMRTKGLIRGHLKLSKKSKNTSKSSKLKKLCIVEVGHFCKIAKSQLSPNLQILSNGPILFPLDLSLHHCPRVLDSSMSPYLIFIIWFDFLLNLFIFNQIKSYKIPNFDYMRFFAIFRIGFSPISSSNSYHTRSCAKRWFLTNLASFQKWIKSNMGALI